MLTIVLVIVGVLVVLGIAAFFVFQKVEPHKPPLTVRHAVSEAKEALLDKENKPDIFRRMKDKTEVPFNPAKDNPGKAEIPGNYQLRWPKLQINYQVKDISERIALLLEGYDQKVSLYYSDGTLVNVDVGDETLDEENFERRHAGTISEQLRAFVRYHMRFPGGSLKVEKAPEPQFKPTLDLSKGHEVRLKGKPPPGKLPNFED